MVIGRVGAVIAKYLLDIATLLIVRAADPEFVAVAETVLLVPTLTVPKSTDVLFNERAAVA